MSEEEINSIDEGGHSLKAELKLYTKISEAMLGPHRFSHHFYSFHKPLDAQQGEALARHFLEPYVISGKVDRPENYAAVGQVVKDYTPAVITSTFNQVANSTQDKVSIEDMLNPLKMEMSRSKLRENTELIESLRGRITYLVDLDQVKKINGELNYSSLALAAKDLSPRQIKDAIEKHAPEVLTQENIIAAFEKVKGEG
ncbi:MAG: hypothetical protein HYY52_05360 [Candidatus Melainabacteria bacterium]|nr:hypothetical protein [Candidatus Melainabacteria bacterium]